MVILFQKWYNLKMTYLFTSESVSEGHPDKLCDQISDAILDACLTQDSESRVAAECFISNNLVVVGGEISTTATLDIDTLVRDTLSAIGYTDAHIGIDARTCEIRTVINSQSADINQGISDSDPRKLGAGDQGLMFGYACTQTESYMPLPIMLAHELIQRLSEVRRSGKLSYLRPDAKSQVSVRYDADNKPVMIDTVVLSTQHDDTVSQADLAEAIIQDVIQPVLPTALCSPDTKFIINPSGRFVIGGPLGDAGLTGRKIIVDTYGGWARHGGGAFSGKDASKVDRSVAYMARYIAKNLVAAGVASELELQLAYAIGLSDPVSISVRSDSDYDQEKIINIIQNEFPLTPAGIIAGLKLKQPVFSQTSVYGHFGRPVFAWEQCDMVERIKRYLV